MSQSAILQLTDVHKHYRLGDEQIDALHQIQLTVNPGEFVAIQGPSGSGKSTLLQILGLLDDFDQGEYRFNGVSVAGLSTVGLTELRRQHIGFVFQSYNLVPVMTAAENIAYPLQLLGYSPDQVSARVNTLLDQVGLQPQADRRPDQLSGGQRQRVAIARALVKRPLLVVADEPTANLDSKTAYQIIGLMRQLGQEMGATLVVATHDPRMSAECDRVLNLVDGRILVGEPQ
jgi:putative ABC transport system ATP-binding protein